MWLNNSTQEKGTSNWITVLPLFYRGWTVTRVPNVCVCAAKFNLHHPLYCKRVGFILCRHNELRVMIS